MSAPTIDAPALPPVWVRHAFWRGHRLLHRLSGGRFLWTPASRLGWGAMHVTTTGRLSGLPRTVILGYIEDGEHLVTLAMNGWEDGDPAWWRNLQADPSALVRLPHQPERRMHAHAAEGDERERLWRRWAEIDEGMDAYAALRSVPTAVVVFVPQP